MRADRWHSSRATLSLYPTYDAYSLPALVILVVLGTPPSYSPPHPLLCIQYVGVVLVYPYPPPFPSLPVRPRARAPHR